MVSLLFPLLLLDAKGQKKSSSGNSCYRHKTLDCACISTIDFNFLYTELRLDSLKGHSLCNRVYFVLPFVLFIENSIFLE